MTTDAPKEPAEPPTGIKRKWLQLKEWHKNVWPGASIPKVAAIFALGLILWWLVPEGLGHDTWQVFVLFVCTIVAAVAEPLPLAGVCLVSLGVCAVTGVRQCTRCIAPRYVSSLVGGSGGIALFSSG
ncbi:hypothetical protein FOZ63_018486 [Perkinsus olseni]|uniref:Uncharacterized protein n=1 Tax=Perkinsus olseni TaxID=32597 RepID=A0A7J6TPX3_PEROL|nr:hypothetical protein FOZ63_018486 [Perkinsus olseni]